MSKSKCQHDKTYCTFSSKTTTQPPDADILNKVERIEIDTDLKYLILYTEKNCENTIGMS